MGTSVIMPVYITLPEAWHVPYLHITPYLQMEWITPSLPDDSWYSFTSGWKAQLCIVKQLQDPDKEWLTGLNPSCITRSSKFNSSVTYV